MARNWLLKLLTAQPEARMTAQEAARHPWLTGVEGDVLDDVTNVMNHGLPDVMNPHITDGMTLDMQDVMNTGKTVILNAVMTGSSTPGDSASPACPDLHQQTRYTVEGQTEKQGQEQGKDHGKEQGQEQEQVQTELQGQKQERAQVQGQGQTEKQRQEQEHEQGKEQGQGQIKPQGQEQERALVQRQGQAEGQTARCSPLQEQGPKSGFSLMQLEDSYQTLERANYQTIAEVRKGSMKQTSSGSVDENGLKYIDSYKTNNIPIRPNHMKTSYRTGPGIGEVRPEPGWMPQGQDGEKQTKAARRRRLRRTYRHL